MTDAERMLGSRADRILSGASDGPGEARTDVLGVEAVCGIHKRPFLLLFERKDSGMWCTRRTYRLPGSLGEARVQRLVEQQGVSVKSLSAITFTGGLVMARDYVGCAWCLHTALAQCTCGALGCQGANRPHDGHGNYLCGTCDRWRCIMAHRRISPESFSGQALVTRHGEDGGLVRVNRRADEAALVRRR